MLPVSLIVPVDGLATVRVTAFDFFAPDFVAAPAGLIAIAKASAAQMVAAGINFLVHSIRVTDVLSSVALVGCPELAVRVVSAHAAGDVALSLDLGWVLEELLGRALLEEATVVEEHGVVRKPPSLAEVVGHHNESECGRHRP